MLAWNPLLFRGIGPGRADGRLLGDATRGNDPCRTGRSGDADTRPV